MARYAIIEDGIVVNITIGIPADLGAAIAVDLTSQPQVGIGWLYNGSTFTAPVEKKNKYTLAKFIDILTDDELGIILEYVNSTTNTTVARKAKRTWEWWRATNEVDFNDQRTVNAVTWLVQNTDEWTPARATLIAG